MHASVLEHGEWEFEIGASWPSLRWLYGWVFTESKALLMLVPIGGVSFIVGWVLLALAAWRGSGSL